MEIKGNVHCLFEQSGSFKNEFRKLGFKAFDYDIKNDFGRTDYIIDLFKEIKKAYSNRHSLFDSFNQDDLIIAFFPCIYFAATQSLFYLLAHYSYRHASLGKRIKVAIERAKKRQDLYLLLWKLVYVCDNKGLRLIIENPASQPSFLLGGVNFPSPSIIDQDRSKRGDYFTKPTAYWFFGCEPTNLTSITKRAYHKTIQRSAPSKGDGQCSVERSMISPDYARNFICDFILGKKQPNSELSLFDNIDL